MSAHHFVFNSDGNETPAVAGFGDLNSRLLSRPSSPPPAVRQQAALSHNHQLINPFVLPPQTEILRLVHHFFDNTGKLFPYLYKPALLDVLSKMSTNGFENVGRAQLCLLHLIMAFGSTHGPSDVDMETRMRHGDIFFQKALELIPNIALTVDNLESSMWSVPHT